MTVRSDTYAFARPVPYLLERGAEQTITCPIRHGIDGALQVPASGTVTITRPSGVDLVTDAAVTVASSMATYTLTPTAAEVLGEGWTVVWALVMDDGLTYTYRESAYLCEYVPPCVISAVDLYVRIPELRMRIPQYQRTGTGDGTGWQPQIDEAYYALIRRLLDQGRKPWLIREVSGYRDWLLTRALQFCVATVGYSPGSSWESHAKTLYFEHRTAEGQLKLQYSDESPGVRRSGMSAVRLAPTGRPSW